MCYKLVTYEGKKFFSPVYSSNVPQVEDWITFRRVLVVPAYLSVLEDADVILIDKTFNVTKAHDLSVVFPRDAMIRVAALNEE